VRGTDISRNTFGLFVFRGLSFAANILMVSISLKGLGASYYGIWIALSSVGGWIGMLDFGIGNGLRNRLSESLAKDDHNLSAVFVSSAFFTLGGFAGIVTGVLLVLNSYLDWFSILNVLPDHGLPLKLIGSIVFAILGARLAAGLINAILLADQRPSVVGLIDALGSILSLASVYLLIHVSSCSLLTYTIAASYGPVLVLIVATIFLFATRYKTIRPRIRNFRLGTAKNMASLGLKFFLLQLSGLFVFSSAGVLIAHLYGTEEVARYAVAQRYFGFLLVGFGIVLTPYWSAYTQAYVLGEMDWIRSSLKKLRQWMAGLSIVAALMVFLAPLAYGYWISASTEVPQSLSLVFAVYVLLACWCNIHVNLINGVGKVQLQLLVGIANAVLFVPLVYSMTVLNLPGSTTVMLAVCILLVPSSILWPVQTAILLKRGDVGLWTR
jgi:O-antigen/teichoic acid export membrane protein